MLRFAWVWGGGAAAVVTALYAWVRGGAPERWGATVFLASWFLPPFFDHPHGFRYALFIADLLTALAYLWIALRWRRLWSFAAMASQWLAVATHLIVWFMVGVGTWAYITLASIFGGDLPMIILAIGVMTLPRKKRD